MPRIRQSVVCILLKMYRVVVCSDCRLQKDVKIFCPLSICRVVAQNMRFVAVPEIRRTSPCVEVGVNVSQAIACAMLGFLEPTAIYPVPFHRIRLRCKFAAHLNRFAFLRREL